MAGMPDKYLALIDDFNRADQGPPPSANWTKEGTNGCKVVSNQCAGIGASSSAYWNVASLGPDYGIGIDVPVTPTSGLMLRARLNSIGLGTTTGYALQFGAGAFTLYKIDAGNGNVALATVAGSVAGGDSLALETVGAGITGYQKTGGVWSVVLAASDATYAAAGKWGISMGNTTDRVDNFSGGVPPPAVMSTLAVPLVSERGYA